MKVQDTHTNGTGCCKEPIDQNPPTGCCSSQETATYACCCSGEETMNEPCCCGRQEAEAQEGCCSHQETAYQAGCCKATDNLDDDHNQVSHPDMDSLGELQMLLMEANNKYMRLYAEFDNFKKRHAKERMALVDKANEQTLKELLPIVDDFDRCILSLQGAEGGLQHIEGIKLIYDKLGGLLKKYGVQEIEIEQGSPFNADLHEAIMQQPVDDPEIKGKIVSVVEKGYLINAYVLRFAKVIIGV